MSLESLNCLKGQCRPYFKKSMLITCYFYVLFEHNKLFCLNVNLMLYFILQAKIYRIASLKVKVLLIYIVYWTKAKKENFCSKIFLVQWPG